ncbi:GNAT family N-acetyltransferase [Verminephrobacter aporrectodeae]|uniref:GNAT family N-acetyltransferase n=2 Tax=Verminephrobacter aporrectodeae TaxID=1110389 RepID=UPI002244C862|nr:GNAT family N-acetyltransferase [Verminephrobacter aporrectodeae]
MKYTVPQSKHVFHTSECLTDSRKLEKMQKKLHYSESVSSITLEQIADLYDSVGFGVADGYKSQENLLDRLFGHGCHGFFAIHDERLIGMVRVLSDDVICSWVAEACIHPDWQKQGVGRALFNMVTRRFEHTSIYLEALSSQVGFFSKMGIHPESKLVACSLDPKAKPRSPIHFMH